MNIETKIARELINLVLKDDVKTMLEKVRVQRKGLALMNQYDRNKCILYFEQMGKIVQDAINGIQNTPRPD